MAIRNHISFIKEDSGQTIVEFALIVVLLLTILFGIMEFGRAWFYSNNLTNAVRAAARYGAVLPASTAPNVGALRSAIIGADDAYLPAEISQHMDVNDIDTDPDNTFVKVFAPDGSERNNGDIVRRGDTIEVTVTYNFTFLVGSYFLEIFSKDPDGVWPLKRSASMQYEEGT